MKCLIINSYGGSLVLAAYARQLEIIGSYEDAGYGSPIQEANFPLVEHVREFKDWPKDQDLSEVLVIAHPPCAAFSQANSGQPGKTGPTAEKFLCTVKVLRYAMGCNALAIAVESVTGALEGAREVHDSLANEHGYDVFRILQNAADFGVPQWRPRFWCIFIRRLVVSELALSFKPNRKCVADVVGQPGPETQEPAVERLVAKYRGELIQRFTEEQVDQVFAEGEGYLEWAAKKVLELDPSLLPPPPKAALKPWWDNPRFRIMQHLFGKSVYENLLPYLLSPRGLTPVLMSYSCWWIKERPVSLEEFKAFMGFPRDYFYPPKFERKVREFLSRGVCPPVAEWVLKMLEDNLAIPTDVHPNLKVIKAGETADFMPSKKAVLDELASYRGA